MRYTRVFNLVKYQDTQAPHKYIKNFITKVVKFLIYTNTTYKNGEYNNKTSRLMIDLITLTKAQISETELSNIVESSKLEKCSRGDRVHYESAKYQREKEHINIKIDSNSKLEITINLHKQYELLQTKAYTNYGAFTMVQAQDTILQVLAKIGAETEQLQVKDIEIGLNLTTSKDCRAYLDKMLSIGIRNDIREVYIDPRYKDERAKTTQHHRTARKYFKMYDKCFEALDKKRKDVPCSNILRIEVVYKRLHKMSFENFFTPSNLEKYRRKFFNDWRTLTFERDILAPPKFGAKNKELCKTILKIGSEKALLQAREKHKAGALTIKEFRTIREFIQKSWESEKHKIIVPQSTEEQEFRELLECQKKRC